MVHNNQYVKLQKIITTVGVDYYNEFNALSIQKKKKKNNKVIDYSIWVFLLFWNYHKWKKYLKKNFPVESLTVGKAQLDEREQSLQLVFKVKILQSRFDKKKILKKKDMAPQFRQMVETLQRWLSVCQDHRVLRDRTRNHSRDYVVGAIKYIGKDDWLGIELDNDNNYFTTKEGLWLVYHKENNCQTTGECSHNKEVLFEVSDRVLLKDKTIGQYVEYKLGCSYFTWVGDVKTHAEILMVKQPEASIVYYMGPFDPIERDQQRLSWSGTERMGCQCYGRDFKGRKFQ
ncbi:hypothetical protein RFI_04380 [Reticulomyxa filosa]|uniref:Uncharacterized protein n=1 Tax=Reticulomyxa filosa TaxID=46433 RepID=X6P3E9_RETFI|nr:hypothetical protein RFI_04380 [Reticulomyxa filosa]|eukprot:ETO32736.1 hypothetical protein RFI_04380 [Reticulomyxa filosa]